MVIDSNAGSEFTVVDTDQALGVRQATEHLLALGHRQVWDVAGPQTPFSASRCVESWRRTLQNAGIQKLLGKVARTAHDKDERTAVPTELIVRDSTGVPRAHIASRD